MKSSLTILFVLLEEKLGDGKVTTGITDWRQLSVLSDVAF